VTRLGRAVALHAEVFRCMLMARRRIRRQGLEPTLDLLCRPRPDASDVDPERVVRAARRLHRLAGKGTCLEESAALTAVLTRHGRPAELVLGSRRDSQTGWGAHAWVIVDGRKYDLLGAAAHTSLASYSSVTGWRPQPLPLGKDDADSDDVGAS